MGLFLTDMSQATFESLAPLDVGEIEISWQFESK
jgi:hypothetical protein